MSDEKVEGKERKEHGKAEEKIGKEFDDKGREIAGKEHKEFGKAEEKVGKEKEKQGIPSGSTGSGYACASCGASFASYDERARHNQQVHKM
jgi:uncharacterized protein YjbJ (UPF0337 family)